MEDASATPNPVEPVSAFALDMPYTGELETQVDRRYWIEQVACDSGFFEALAKDGFSDELVTVETLRALSAQEIDTGLRLVELTERVRQLEICLKINGGLIAGLLGFPQGDVILEAGEDVVGDPEYDLLRTKVYEAGAAIRAGAGLPPLPRNLYPVS